MLLVCNCCTSSEEKAILIVYFRFWNAHLLVDNLVWLCACFLLIIVVTIFEDLVLVISFVLLIIIVILVSYLTIFKTGELLSQLCVTLFIFHDKVGISLLLVISPKNCQLLLLSLAWLVWIIHLHLCISIIFSKCFNRSLRYTHYSLFIFIVTNARFLRWND